MSGMTTKTKRKTSITVDLDKVRAVQAITGAASTSGAIDAALSRLIADHAEEAFWASLDDVTPESYREATAADGDELSDDYGIEDAALDDDRVRT
jgi:hypothetical protein